MKLLKFFLGLIIVIIALIFDIVLTIIMIVPMFLPFIIMICTEIMPWEITNPLMEVGVDLMREIL